MMLSILALAMLCGCTPQVKKQPVILTSFSCPAVVQFGDLKFECVITREDTSEVTIEITAPEELSGMKIESVGEELRTYYKDMEYSMSPEQMGSCSFAMTLISVLNALTRTNDLSVSRSDNGFVYKGECPQGKFMLYQNPDDTYNRITLSDSMIVVFQNRSAGQ